MFDFLYDHYETFKESIVTNKRITTTQWNLLYEKWNHSPYFTIKEIGKTYQGESIHEIKWGVGPIQIAAWSQMHGDEATATMALTDIYTFLSYESPLNHQIWEKLHQNITFHCIINLNKDGAKLWQRETALDIDMNRDAQSQITPEAKLLSAWVDQINPTYSFNLHDQNRLYSAGKSPYQTKIALLATSGDQEGTWTPSRLRAAKLANHLTKRLKKYIGNHLAKWNDEYEPRAFGDTFQERGYGLLLVEAGGMPYDVDKQYLRKLTACMLLDSLYQIATNSLENESIEAYQNLPTNEKCIADIKIKNAPITIDGKHRADLLLNIKETPIDNKTFQYSWILEDIGDMSHMYGITEINGTNLSLFEPTSLKKEKEYIEFILNKDSEIIFKLSDYTQKINQNI